jgi:hypothetical protein
MEAFIIELVVLLFVVALIIIALFSRNATLDKLAEIEGEKKLLEKDGITVEESVRGKNIQAVFRNCRVRLTNKRIIIAQPTLFNKERFFLRAVINYSEKANENPVSAGILLKSPTLSQGFLTLNTSKDRIFVTENNKKPVLEITAPVGGGAVITEPHFWIHTDAAKDFLAAIK